MARIPLEWKASIVGAEDVKRKLKEIMYGTGI